MNNTNKAVTSETIYQSVAVFSETYLSESKLQLVNLDFLPEYPLQL